MYTENIGYRSKHERGIVVHLKRFKLLLSSLQNYFEEEHACSNENTFSGDDTIVTNDKAIFEINELHKYLSYTYWLIESFVSNSSFNERILPRSGEMRETRKESICSIACKFNCPVSTLRIDNPQLHCYTDDEVLPQNTLIKLRSFAHNMSCEEPLTKQTVNSSSNCENYKIETCKEPCNAATMHTIDDLSSVHSNNHDDASLNSTSILEQPELCENKLLEQEEELHNEKLSIDQLSPIVNQQNNVKCSEHVTENVKSGNQNNSCNSALAAKEEKIDNDDDDVDDDWESECVSIPSKEPSPLPLPSLVLETSQIGKTHIEKNNCCEECNELEMQHEPLEEEVCECELETSDMSPLHESLENSPSACIPRLLSSAAVAFDKNISVPKLTFTGIAQNAKETYNTLHDDNCSNIIKVKDKNNSSIKGNDDAIKFSKDENCGAGETNHEEDKVESVTSYSSSELEQQYQYETSSSSELQFCEEESEEEEEFDTIANIAQSYNVTVEEILHWNPFLRSYDMDEPLPANLSIVLPRKQ